MIRRTQAATSANYSSYDEGINGIMVDIVGLAEAGNTAINTIVNATDEIVARNFQHSAVDPALIDDPYDYNRGTA